MVDEEPDKKAETEENKEEPKKESKASTDKKKDDKKKDDLNDAPLGADEIKFMKSYGRAPYADGIKTLESGLKSRVEDIDKACGKKHTLFLFFCALAKKLKVARLFFFVCEEFKSQTKVWPIQANGTFKEINKIKKWR